VVKALWQRKALQERNQSQNAREKAYHVGVGVFHELEVHPNPARREPLMGDYVCERQ